MPRNTKKGIQDSIPISSGPWSLITHFVGIVWGKNDLGYELVLNMKITCLSIGQPITMESNLNICVFY